jgi:hypothetical protein
VRQSGKGQARRVVTLLLGVVMSAGLITGCNGGQDPVLTELLRDPMAGRSQPNATLAAAEDMPHSKGGLIFNKPQPTKVLRSFAPQNQSAQQLYRRLVTTAKAHGWRLDSLPSGTAGTKEFSFGNATISITTNTYVSPTQVVVVLERAS